MQVVKRKLIISSPPAQVKESKDVPKKDNSVTTIIINGKTCTWRNSDFSTDKLKSKIPVGTKARVGRPPSNPGPEQRQEPRQSLGPGTGTRSQGKVGRLAQPELNFKKRSF